MKIRTLFLSVLVFLLSHNLFAAEGMWLPILLKKYNIEQMQAKGFKLTAEDIYDINQASLKDAVVGLVRLSNPFHHFCTGEIISSNGLVLTNHHCGFGQIQQHSSVENDYLKDGFWAKNKKEELTNEGLGVCLLKRMEDVTNQVNKGIDKNSSLETKDSIIQANIKKIEKNATQGTHYLAKVKPFFSGNEYYLSVYEIFRDIRLVGTPPSAVGKFGGDTDNWMWPRHTGDFSMFRIYAGKDNQPADISSENVPYKPLKHLKISLDGIKKGDFTMVMGYPGTTQEYLPSYAIDLHMNVKNPIRIKIRNDAINIMKNDMEKSAETRIKYAAKVASKANGWKKWIGESRGLKRLNAIEKKREQEKEFQNWANQSKDKKEIYGTLLNQYEKLYKEVGDYEKFYIYLSETILGNEIVRFSNHSKNLLNLSKNSKPEEIKKTVNKIKQQAQKFYKDYNEATGKKLFVKLLSYYFNDVDKKYYPEIFLPINKKYKGNTEKYFSVLFEKSIFKNSTTLNNFLDNYSPSKNKKIEVDPIFRVLTETKKIYFSDVQPKLRELDMQIKALHQSYLKGIRELYSNKVFFPDANSTFRIAYGQVDNYKPRDGVDYEYFTTLKGIMEKDNPDIYDYDVPQQIRNLYKAKDFGAYANTDGSMPVCFIASNHTTGGNSGSPVINQDGNLIGINFDRNWEGTMSDLMYDPEMCRNIMLDIRYVLFIIDKYAGAKNLINELDFVKKRE